MRCLYVDLDGTLLGPGGSLLRDGDGGFALDAVRALQACARAGVEVVIYSGRRQQSVFDAARLIGQTSYIFELGCGLVLDGELEWLTGGIVPSAEAGTIFEQITDSRAADVLLEAFDGLLEYHTPWSAGREVSHLFRGHIELDQAAELLRSRGLDWLRVVDNGVIAAHGVSLAGARTGLSPDLERVHAYHLIPAVSSKAAAVARHMQNRGLAPEDCIAAGDSREDLEAEGVVGAFWLVANALQRDPSLAEDIAGRPRVRVSSASYGAGVYEAVVTTLAER